MKKNILLITTGGTIAMKFDQNLGVVPESDLVPFLKSFPQLNDVANITVLEFSNIPSPYMVPNKMMQMAKLITREIDKFDGIVITHGTDTLEETAYLLDLVLETKKPVILTAAMRSGSELGLDGPRNIVGAVRVASNEESYDKGVLVVMNDEIHSARDVIKMDTGKVEAFVSMEYGILGIVDPDRVIYYRTQAHHEKIITDKLDTRVELIKACAGMDGKFISCCINNGVRGIVIEALGRGNLPPDTIPALENALEQDIIIVIVSRTYKGRVLPEYGYTGGGKHLAKMGVILSGDLKGPKARIKLMTLLGKYKTTEEVRQNYPFVLD